MDMFGVQSPTGEWDCQRKVYIITFGMEDTGLQFDRTSVV